MRRRSAGSNKNFMAKSTHIFKPFDWAMIGGVVLCNVFYALSPVFSHGGGAEGWLEAAREFDALGFIAAVAGILCVVLSAKGSILNYLFGAIQVSLYAYISFVGTAYGNAVVNLFYYLPMQFVGFWQWRKRGGGIRGAEAGEAVPSRRLSTRVRVLGAGAMVLLTVGVALILRRFGDAQPWVDSLTAVVCIAAQGLMSFAFMEQWYLWIVFNVFTVVMWAGFTASGTEHAVPTLIMYCFYTINSLNGLRCWRKRLYSSSRT